MAKLLPLKGKYYGTEVLLDSGATITIWTGLVGYTDYKASTREIACGWEPMDGFDHVETQRDLDIAQAIVDVLNTKGY